MDLMNKKFYLKKDKKYRYTPDNILIYNICVGSKDLNTTYDDLNEYFSKYGNYELVKVIANDLPKQCILKFENPENAAKALNYRKHYLNGVRLYAVPCPSWEQPFDFLTNIDQVEISDHLPSKLIQLDDIVLYNIMGNLQFHDQIRLTLCDKRFENMFIKKLLPTMPDTLDINALEKFTQWELRQLFKLFGKHLHGLRLLLPVHHKLQIKHITDFTEEYSPELQTLQLIKFPHFLNVTKLYQRFICTHNITELELTDSYVLDCDLKFFVHLPNLRALGLASNRYICGTFIRRITTLKRLSLYGCHKISNQVLIDICGTLNLTHLDIRFVYNIINITSLIFLSPNLEVLRFTRIYGDHMPTLLNMKKLTHIELHYPYSCGDGLSRSLYELSETSPNIIDIKVTTDNATLTRQMCIYLSNFKKLRRLALIGCDMRYTGGLLLNILLSNLNNLEELYIEDCDFPTDVAANVIQHAPKLRIFSLRYCRNIKIDFLNSLINAFRQHYCNGDDCKCYRGYPVILLMRGTRIPERFLGSKDYFDNLKYMIISSYDAQPHCGLLDENREQMRYLEKYIKHIEYPKDEEHQKQIIARHSNSPPSYNTIVNYMKNPTVPQAGDSSETSDVEEEIDDGDDNNNDNHNDEFYYSTFMDDSLQFFPA